MERFEESTKNKEFLEAATRDTVADLKKRQRDEDQQTHTLCPWFQITLVPAKETIHIAEVAKSGLYKVWRSEEHRAAGINNTDAMELPLKT